MHTIEDTHVEVKHVGNPEEVKNFEQPSSSTVGYEPQNRMNPTPQRQVPKKIDTLLKPYETNSKRERRSRSRSRSRSLNVKRNHKRSHSPSYDKSQSSSRTCSLDRRRKARRSRSRSPDVKRTRNHSHSRSRSRSRDRSRSSSRRHGLGAKGSSLPSPFVKFLEKWKIDPRKEQQLVNYLMSKDPKDRQRIVKNFRPNPNRDPVEALAAYSQFKKNCSIHRFKVCLN